MRGSTLFVSQCFYGRCIEGILGDTSGFGTAMVISYGVNVNTQGKATWVHYGAGSSYGAAADGDPRLLAILVPGFPSSLEGKIPVPPGAAGQTAGVVGSRCFLYCPLPGDEMNVLVRGAAGTGSANAFFVGERLVYGHTDGKFVVQSTSANAAQWTVMEHLDQVPDIDTLVWCMRA